MTTTQQAERDRARAILARDVARMRRISVSFRGRNMIEGLVKAGLQRECYEPSVLGEPIATRNGMDRRLRERQRALVRYAVERGADVRDAWGYAHALASPFAAVFGTTERQAMRWLNRAENAHARRATHA
jgi:hypothetical protein